MLDNVPIRTRLFITLLGVTVPALVAIGLVSYFGGKVAVERATFDHLTSVRAGKASQIRNRFERIEKQARTLAKNRMITEAIMDFDDAHQALQRAVLTDEQRDALLVFYLEEFLTRLETHSDTHLDPAAFLAKDTADLYLQSTYVVGNPYPSGEKHQLDDAGDGSVYSKVHSETHPVLRDYIDEFGFHDLILITGSGQVVYTVAKEVDFGTDLIDGPFQNSNLADVFLKAQGDYLSDRVQLVDFASYAPSYGEPASFVAAPIVDGAWLLGVLVIQIAIEEIDQVMTNDGNWRRDGLGKTGESYLVGPDGRLRSNSRFFLEDPESYIDMLEAAGVKEIDLRKIRNFGTSILLQEVNSSAVRSVLKGETATTVTTDYRGERVLSSFEPLAVEGLDWVVLSEIDSDEAFAPIRTFARRIVFGGAVLSLAIFGLSWLVARRFVEPIVELEDAASRFAAGDDEVQLRVRGDDELGRLTSGFNRMVTAIRSQTEELTRNNEELQGVKSVILRWGPDGGITFINKFGCEHFGFSEAELVGQPLVGTIVIDDEESRKSIRKMVNEIATNPVKYENDESENTRSNGDVLWTAWRNKPILNEDGSLKEILTIGIDITERRKAEDQIRKLSQAVEQGSSSVVITDLNGDIEYANPKFTEVTGYALEEVLGQNPRVLKGGDQPKEFYANLWATITSGREWRGEFRNRKKNGELYWESASISPIRDAKGEITHYVAIKDDITERRRIEQEVAEQKQLLENTLESLTHPFYVIDAEDFTIKVANSAARRLGKGGESTCHALTHRRDKPCDSAEHPCPMALVKQTGRPTVVEHIHFDENDEPRFVEVHGYPVFDEDGSIVQMIEYSLDITKRKEFEEQLRQSEERIRSMVSNMPGVVYRCLLDDDWTMLFISDEIRNLSGYPPEDFLGENPVRTFASIMHPDDVGPIALNAARAVEARQPYNNEYRVIDRDGETHWVFAKGQATYDEDGTPLHLDGTIFDVSDKKEMQFELEDAKEAAESANRAKSAFLANMSHELRTPMNAIIGYSEMLAEEAEDDGLDAMIPDLEKINTAGKHLLALINDILDLSKIEAGRVDLYLERFELAQMLDEAVATVTPLVAKNGNRMVTEFDDNLGQVRADLTKLRQALFNLLSNAAKFTKDGAVTLAARRERRDDGDWIRLSVTDTGIGIPADKLEHVFEEFSQADSSTTRNFGGTGLGLPISRRFCQMMGGDITVNSELGQGSSFTIELPAAVDALEAAKTLAEIDEAAELKIPAGVHPVLVIDDDPDSRELLRRTLEADGYIVAVAASGDEGLEMARTLLPALITLDVMMPGMDGWAVLQQLKGDPSLARIPVMMVTISSEKEIGSTLGAVDHLTKPVDRDTLRRLVSQYATSGGGGHALVVDDDEGIRSLFRRALVDDGWAVVEAANGAEALEFVGSQCPDIVLLDLMMPVMDGFEFLMEFRTRPECVAIPVIVVTAKDLTEEDRNRLAGGVERIVEKGALTASDILGHVRGLVGRPDDLASDDETR